MTYKRDLGAYISPRDLTQLFSKAIDTPILRTNTAFLAGSIRH